MTNENISYAALILRIKSESVYTNVEILKSSIIYRGEKLRSIK